METPRIQILNWREYGDDESFVRLQCFGPGDDTDLGKTVLAESRGEEAESIEQLEDDEEGPGMIYINDDITIQDGEEFETPDGRKYRVHFEEVK